jgi:hypothetical protein
MAMSKGRMLLLEWGRAIPFFIDLFYGFDVTAERGGL